MKFAKKHLMELIVLVVVWMIAAGLAITLIAPGPSSPQVHRYLDLDAGVVCWINGSSLSCLPLNQTKLYGGNDETQLGKNLSF